MASPIQNIRPLEDEIEKRLLFQSKPAFMSKLASEVLRVELDILTNVRTAIYTTRFLEYFTKAGMCTVRQDKQYIYAQIQKRLASYGYETTIVHIETLLEHRLDLIFMRDYYQKNELTATNFLPRHARLKRKVDAKAKRV